MNPRPPKTPDGGPAPPGNHPQGRGPEPTATTPALVPLGHPHAPTAREPPGENSGSPIRVKAGPGEVACPRHEEKAQDMRPQTPLNHLFSTMTCLSLIVVLWARDSLSVQDLPGKVVVHAEVCSSQLTAVAFNQFLLFEVFKLRDDGPGPLVLRSPSSQAVHRMEADALHGVGGELQVIGSHTDKDSEVHKFHKQSTLTISLLYGQTYNKHTSSKLSLPRFIRLLHGSRQSDQCVDDLSGFPALVTVVFHSLDQVTYLPHPTAMNAYGCQAIIHIYSALKQT
ncbi:hypothetical protein F2P81_003879 [Scophthalmus maximus]|uniref:Uncharacterized protein n=1 Tax=Scophthalmus maximus TaxID=52904 RepID=A0A6A4TPP0_SCOMX|nr:hypothetical protein F2P81_003879 [Scophthalmus maximus]